MQTNYDAIRAKNYLKDLRKSIRISLDRIIRKKTDKIAPKKCIVIIASHYVEWQRRVIDTITSENRTLDDWKKVFIDDAALNEDIKKKSFAFSSYIVATKCLMYMPAYINRERLKSKVGMSYLSNYRLLRDKSWKIIKKL